jgi:broad specificity phosphatase PhoE
MKNKIIANSAEQSFFKNSQSDLLSLRYEEIKKNIEKMKEKYRTEVLSSITYKKRTDYLSKLAEIGLKVNFETGHLYLVDKSKLPEYDAKIIWVRHGETYGNLEIPPEIISAEKDNTLNEIGLKLTLENKLVVSEPSKVPENIKDYILSRYNKFEGKEESELTAEMPVYLGRIYQGAVDNTLNQLTMIGDDQAKKLVLSATQFSVLLNAKLLPGVVFHSGRTRAKYTGCPFFEDLNRRLGKRSELSYVVQPDFDEQNFGDGDNRRVIDIGEDNPMHLFYLDQNVLVKTPEGESFLDMLLRVHRGLQGVSSSYQNKTICIVAHSMSGAAAGILTGNAVVNDEDDNYICFDGVNPKTGEKYLFPNGGRFAMNFSADDWVNIKKAATELDFPEDNLKQIFLNYPLTS